MYLPGGQFPVFGQCVKIVKQNGVGKGHLPVLPAPFGQIDISIKIVNCKSRPVLFLPEACGTPPGALCRTGKKGVENRV